MAPVVIDGLLCGILDVFRGIEIRLAKAQIDDVDAFGSQFSAKLGLFKVSGH